MRLRLLLLLAVGLLVPGDAAADNVKLAGSVGPGFTISIRGSDGLPVTQLDPGTYDIVVNDQSEEHNFHLGGPGVDMATEVEFIGTVTWTVTFGNGRYSVQCDPHAGQMFRTFVVGTPPPAAPPATPAAKKLVAVVGPGKTISLRDEMGMTVRKLAPGAYSILVRDRSRTHNVHLAGAGVNRKTAIAALATVTWKVTLKAGTLRFFSDASPKKLRGSVTVQ